MLVLDVVVTTTSLEVTGLIAVVVGTANDVVTGVPTHYWIEIYCIMIRAQIPCNYLSYL